jgi:hypothetical protein
MRISVELYVSTGDYHYRLEGIYTSWGEVLESILDFFASHFQVGVWEIIERMK